MSRIYLLKEMENPVRDTHQHNRNRKLVSGDKQHKASNKTRRETRDERRETKDERPPKKGTVAGLGERKERKTAGDERNRKKSRERCR